MPFFQRTLTQVMRIHNALYDGEDIIVERGKQYPVETVKEKGKDFRRVTIGPFVFITQNVAKPSPATKSMAKASAQGEKLRISWVLKGDDYVGRVETSQAPDREENYKVNDFVRSFQNTGLVSHIKHQGRREG